VEAPALMGNGSALLNSLDEAGTVSVSEGVAAEATTGRTGAA